MNRLLALLGRHLPDEPVTLDDLFGQLTDMEHADGLAAEDITTYLHSIEEQLGEIVNRLDKLIEVIER